MNWISTENKLPENNQQVLIYYGSYFITNFEKLEKCFTSSIDFPKTIWIKEGIPIYWMPLTPP